jgi:hypothetical protein
MNTLAEIEAAVETLPPDQQEELIRFLARLRSAEQHQRRATLVTGPAGTVLLEAPSDAPPMTTETVKRMLEDFP